MKIDVHVHLLPKRVRSDRSPLCQSDPAFGAIYSNQKARLASEEDIIAYLDESAIDKAVVFGFPWDDHVLVRENNDEVGAFRERYPDRVIPFAALSARGGARAYREAERTLAAGFAGLGELAVYSGGWTGNNLALFSACFEVAAKASAPVLLHVNEPVGHEYPGKTTVDFRALLETIRDNPGVDFILAHWGGGVFVYALMPEIREVMKRTYFDTAASPFLYRPDVYETARRAIGEDKVLFGSDFPLLGIRRYERELDEAGAEADFRAAVLGENARRLLKL